jgi:hypothetical protein
LKEERTVEKKKQPRLSIVSLWAKISCRSWKSPILEMAKAAPNTSGCCEQYVKKVPDKVKGILMCEALH